MRSNLPLMDAASRPQNTHEDKVKSTPANFEMNRGQRPATVILSEKRAATTSDLPLMNAEEFTALASRVGRVESSIESLQVILAAVLSKVDDLEEESQLVEMFVDDVVQSVKPDTGFDA
nr:hypothetical protein BaRGS_011633 [Batillaria attramentaria]